MSKKLIHLICFVLALSLVGDVQAADVAWADATGDHLWSTPANWDSGTVPTSADKVKIRISPGPTVVNPGAVADVVQPAAGSSTADLTVDGGTLTIADRLVVAQSDGSNGTVNMISGTITVGGRFAVARYGLGTLNMTGGTITLEGALQMPEMATGTAHANLHGGIITADNLEMRVAGGVGTIDIRAGTLIINGDRLSTVQGYIDNGWITAYDGNGTLQLDYNVTNPETTTLTAFIPKLTTASNPIPAYPATDVPRDVTLSWKPGIYAVKHDVYFGTNFDDVNDADRTNPLGVLVNQNQDLNSYSPAKVLQWEQTYYWRIDEVNAPPDYTIYKGDVWQFTVEPFAYPIAGENIIATASSSAADRAPENTVNGSGLDDSGLLHGKDAENTMWLSSMTGPQPTWIEYEFDGVYKVHEMWVWNSNETMEPVIGFGSKDVTIEYSTNGIDYTTLGTAHEFARAPGAPDYEHNTTVDLSGVAAKYVRLTANSNWGGILNQYGLSEVRFFHIPVHAKAPYPASGATDVNVDVVLSFRAGREAVTHDLYLSTDQQAVVDGTAPVSALTETSYGPLSLDLGKTYYWRVDEVNEAEALATWQGVVWDFATKEYFVVDDIESYNDLDPGDPESNRIFFTWIDGYEQPTNGSLVGYDVPPFCEQTIVHGGKQSMPFFFNNTGAAAYSEAELTLSPAQDWTTGGVKTLSLWFSGAASNTAAQMYVKVNGSKVAYDGDASNLTAAAWQPWNIELTSLGAGLQNVTKLSIGIDGNSAAGTLLFDDIRLYPYDRQLITPAEPSNVGLVGHYKLDQDVTDSSGNNNHGTLGGDPQWTAGKIGGALDFDGDDYVDCGNPSQLDFGTGSWSISAWIKTPASTNNMNIFAKGGDNSGGIRYMLSVSETDDHKACLTVDDNATKVQSTSSVTVDDDQWHHIVGIRDESSLRTYVDGALDGTNTLAAGYDISGTSQANAYIGAGWNFETSVVQKYFIGIIDDVRIYGRVLTEEEIAWLAGRTKPSDKPF